ncbi:phosphodiester glycosidase family protein [bacterium]|nr:phosphodiester glycosidase family protein [bacterium]
MRFWKLFLLLILALFCTTPAMAVGEISIDKDNGIYHIILKGEKVKKKIKFVTSEDLITNREAHIKGNAALTINAGFFDPKNGKTISYVVTDKITSADPMFNPSLLANPFFRKNMNMILNRSEFRVMQCGNKFEYAIVSHKSEVPFGCSLITSAQGGPLILPELRMEEEGFIVKDEEGNVTRESASVLHKTSRTIIGLKGTDECHILIITDDNPMNLYEVQKLCSELKLERAMAFDGGSSTSMNYKKSIEVTSLKGDGAGRMLKSFMLVY